MNIPEYTEALERYTSVFRRGESSIAGIRSELAMIRNDTMLSVPRDAIDAVAAHLRIAELALEALGTQTNEMWKIQKAKHA